MKRILYYVQFKDGLMYVVEDHGDCVYYDMFEVLPKKKKKSRKRKKRSEISRRRIRIRQAYYVSVN